MIKQAGTDFICKGPTPLSANGIATTAAVTVTFMEKSMIHTIANIIHTNCGNVTSSVTCAEAVAVNVAIKRNLPDPYYILSSCLYPCGAGGLGVGGGGGGVIGGGIATMI